MVFQRQKRGDKKMVEMMPEHMGYDRAIVVFSPDGRLFQVEYAREAVKKGATAAGVVFKDGVVLCALKRTSKLIKFGDKIFKIDDHIGLAATGYVADARVLVDAARVKAQQNRIVYDEPISLHRIAKFLADRQQLYTQHAGVRPYGVSLLIGGVNDEPVLYGTDPSGLLLECTAKAVGKGAKKVNKYYEDRYKPGMDRGAAIKFAIAGVKKENKVSKDSISIVVITKKGYERVDPASLKL